MKRQLLGALVIVLAFGLARTVLADPVKMDWPSIPDGYGMNYFYGRWVGNHERDGIVTYAPKGVIDSYDGTGPLMPYVVLIEHPKYVLIYEKNYFGDDDIRYYFQSLHLGDSTSLEIGICKPTGEKTPAGPWRDLGEEDLLKGKDHLLAMWNADFNCNPALGKNLANEEWPWGEGWNHPSYWKDSEPQNNLPDWLDERLPTER